MKPFINPELSKGIAKAERMRLAKRLREKANARTAEDRGLDGHIFPTAIMLDFAAWIERGGE